MFRPVSLLSILYGPVVLRNPEWTVYVPVLTSICFAIGMIAGLHGNRSITDRNPVSRQSGALQPTLVVIIIIGWNTLTSHP